MIKLRQHVACSQDEGSLPHVTQTHVSRLSCLCVRETSERIGHCFLHSLFVGRRPELLLSSEISHSRCTAKLTLQWTSDVCVFVDVL